MFSAVCCSVKAEICEISFSYLVVLSVLEGSLLCSTECSCSTSTSQNLKLSPMKTLWLLEYGMMTNILCV